MPLAAYPKMLREGRERRGFTIGQVAWRLGITRQQYVELEAGRLDVTPDLWQRMCDVYGWPQSFD